MWNPVSTLPEWFCLDLNIRLIRWSIPRTIPLCFGRSKLNRHAARSLECGAQNAIRLRLLKEGILSATGFRHDAHARHPLQHVLPFSHGAPIRFRLLSAQLDFAL